MENKLTHIDEAGKARMVDVSDKADTKREAVAQGMVYMSESTRIMLFEGEIPKGDVIAAARIAGIMSAKKTSELIPLCHQVPLDGVFIDIVQGIDEGSVVIEAIARCSYKTGVEMEALTAVSVAALTIYDMCKAVDKRMIIGDIKLMKKTGGKSGEFIR